MALLTQEGGSGSRKRKCVQLQVTRPVYTEMDFQEGYKHCENDISVREKLKNKVNKIEITPKNVWHFLCTSIPILKWLPSYDLRNNIVGDLISGLTTAIMRIPQEMAYAILATLPPVTGLYTAFFSVLTYAILGTSRHISIGTGAVICVMVGDAINIIVAEEARSKQTAGGAIRNDDDDTELRIQVAVSLCLLVGIIQIGMGILRLGIVTIYLSEPLVHGFITAASLNVITGQFPKLFGVEVNRYTGFIAPVYTCIEFFSELSTANTCAIIISITSILILVFFGEVNDRQAAKGWCRKAGEKGKKLPLPSEVLVVILVTLASDIGRFEEKYGLPVIGEIPTGLPLPTVPPVKYFSSLVGNAFAITIVGFAMHVSLAQIFSRKHNYELDANQEFIAYGGSNIIGSFFQCFPCSNSMSRGVVQEGSGGKTQLASIFASVVLLAILLWLGPLFTQLPECALAAFIIVALRGMMRQFTELPKLWKMSLTDFLLWSISFSLVFLFGVDLGLLLGVIFALITIVVRSQSPYCTLMGRIPETDIYRDIAFVQGVEDIPGIKIFCCASSLSFINADHFRNSLYKKTGVNPRRILIARAKRRGHKLKKKQLAEDIEKGVNVHDESAIPASSPSKLHTVIIECSMFTYVDVVGVKTLQAIVADYDMVDIHVIFANCKDAVRKTLTHSSTINKKQEIGLDRMYISLHDAVLSHMGGARSRAGTYLEQLESVISTNANVDVHDNLPMESNMHRKHCAAENSNRKERDTDVFQNNFEESQQGNTNFSYTPDIHGEAELETFDTNF